MEVIIDSREQSRIKTATDYFTKLGYKVNVKELNTGDYLFNNKVVFEFKTQDDFIGSILDGRVFNEAIKQKENYQYHFVIIQGTSKDRTTALQNPHRTFTLEQYLGAIARLNTYTTVIQSPGLLNEAFYTMHKQTEKILDGKTLVKRFGTKSINPAFNFLAYCVDDIKGERAKKIVNTLGLNNLQDVMELSYNDLINVDGIGDKLANKIIKTIR